MKRIVLILMTYAFSLSATDLMMGHHFRQLCDHDITTPPHKIRKGDAIYIEMKYLYSFFKHMHPKITAPYILVTHGSGGSVPEEFEPYLEDEKLLAWFGKNITRIHPKLRSLPLGLPSYSPENQAIMKEVASSAKALRNRQADKWVYCSLSMQTNPRDRGRLYECLKDKSFVYWPYERKDFRGYITDLSCYRFVACPCGSAIDTYRTWESLFVGAIPIISRSGLRTMGALGGFEKMFDGMAVLIVDDWQDVTLELLEQTFDRFAYVERLSSSYWVEAFHAFRKKNKDI